LILNAQDADKIPLLAQRGSSLIRGFSAGVGSKPDIDAVALTQRPFIQYTT